MPVPLAPTILLAAGAVCVVIGQGLKNVRVITGFWFAAWLGACAALRMKGVLAQVLSAGQSRFGGAWIEDEMAFAAQAMLLLFGLMMFAISVPSTEESDAAFARRSGFIAFLLAGAMLITAANDAISLALSLEIVQLASIALLKLEPYSAKSMRLDAAGVLLHESADSHGEGEAAPLERVIWLGIVSSLFLWIGIALLVSLTASTQFDDVRSVLTAAYRPGAGRIPIGSGSKLGVLALGMIIMGMASRVGLIPWQSFLETWFSGFRFRSAGIVILGAQAAAAVALLRLCGTVWIGFGRELIVLLIVLAGATFVSAAAMAARGLSPGEGSVRRWMTSFVMLHGAWLTVGVIASAGELNDPAASLANASGQPGAASITLFSSAAGLFGLAGLFALLSSLSRTESATLPGTLSTVRDVEFVDELLGLVQTVPAAAVLFAVLLLSQIGQPPLWGFWSKWLLMASAFNMRAASNDLANPTIEPHHGVIVLQIVSLISTLICAGAVLHCLRVTLLESPISRVPRRGGNASLLVAIVAALLLVTVGMAPTLVLTPLSRISPSRPAPVPSTPSGTKAGSSTA